MGCSRDYKLKLREVAKLPSQLCHLTSHHQVLKWLWSNITKRIISVNELIKASSIIKQLNTDNCIETSYPFCDKPWLSCECWNRVSLTIRPPFDHFITWDQIYPLFLEAGKLGRLAIAQTSIPALNSEHYWTQTSSQASASALGRPFDPLALIKLRMQ